MAAQSIMSNRFSKPKWSFELASCSASLRAMCPSPVFPGSTKVPKVNALLNGLPLRISLKKSAPSVLSLYAVKCPAIPSILGTRSRNRSRGASAFMKVSVANDGRPFTLAPTGETTFSSKGISCNTTWVPRLWTSRCTVSKPCSANPRTISERPPAPWGIALRTSSYAPARLAAQEYTNAATCPGIRPSDKSWAKRSAAWAMGQLNPCTKINASLGSAFGAPSKLWSRVTFIFTLGARPSKESKQVTRSHKGRKGKYPPVIEVSTCASPYCTVSRARGFQW
mmetsp:Transcript_44049/g.108554  ORF Transcript_44049/g.108554 Transcript_44049/m.108554 type:complete len:281 (-) Transcript_44049:369-1211(-)